MSHSIRVNRRRFLQTSWLALIGSGLAGPSLFLNRTRAATGENPSDFIGIGFIGVGGQGNSNLGALMKNAVAVCDVDTAHLAKTKQRVEKATGRTCAAYKDYRQLLEDKAVDAVLISTPDHWHALPTIHACQAGKDVYCEKPLTLTIAEGQAMVKAAHRYQRIVQTGSQQRSDPKFRLACELVRSGRLGAIQNVRVGIAKVNFAGPPVADSEPPAELDYELWLGPAPWRPYNLKRVHYLFRFFWDYSGGQMTNWGAHHLDIAQWALGMDESGPVSIEAKARYHAENWYEVPEWCEITYRYANGVTVSCSQEHKMGALFEGEKGSIYVNRGVLQSTPEEIVSEPLGDGDVHLYKSANHHRNWLECIKSRKLPIADVVIGHRTATVCHLGNIAMRTGRKLQWDPAAEKIIGDADAAKRTTYTYRKPWELPEIS
ncbi:MAG: Gfo/Idh/MocA family protein [Verrucomicrobiia bacterium]